MLGKSDKRMAAMRFSGDKLGGVLNTLMQQVKFVLGSAYWLNLTMKAGEQENTSSDSSEIETKMTEEATNSASIQTDTKENMRLT